MAEALVSGVLEQLISVVAEGIKQEVRLVVGVDKEVEKLRSNLEAIQAVLIDAEARQVKQTTVRLWLDRFKQASYDIEDVLDEWNYALLKQQIDQGLENVLIPRKKKGCFSFPSSCFSFQKASLRHDIAVRIKEVNEKLDVIAKQKEMYNFHMIRGIEKSERVQSTTFIDLSEICGRVEEKTMLIHKLCESSEKHLPIISLIRMGDIGKTTFVQLAYNDKNAINNFDKRIWICVSEPFDEYRIVKAIIEALEGCAPNLGELDSLLQRISRCIGGKKILLVLDDVWNEDYKNWEPLYHCLKNCFHGSKILITTRKESVVCMLGSTDIFNIKELSDKEWWLLFQRLAFFGMSQEKCENFEEIGRQILSKCKGLPLATKTIGSLLRFKKHWKEWKSVLDSELWKVEEIEKEIFRPLSLSYDDLPCMINRCFVYCAIFPKDYEINKDELIKLWMAQGYVKEEENKAMEIVGEEYFDYLASRSLFQEFGKDDQNNVFQCKMHNLVHDFAQFLSKNECLHIEVGSLKEPIINSCYHEQVYHLMVTIYGEDLFPDSIFSLRRMRSLLYNIKDCTISLPPNILPKLFGKLTCLKALSIREEDWVSESLIKDIPKEVGKLIHLRYLNLRWLALRKLPEALCELYNLQTLDINFCEKLEELPQGMEKLIKLSIYKIMRLGH